jgi:dethiobiotin synthetase
MAGVTISMEKIVTAVNALSIKAECLLVEGAGGLYAPLTEDIFIMDAVIRLGLPAVLVCSPGLGTLNHTILSVHALKERNVPLAGIAINNRDGLPVDDIFIDNCCFITNFVAPVPVCVNSPGKTNSPSLMEFCDGLAQKWL